VRAERAERDGDEHRGGTDNDCEARAHFPLVPFRIPVPAPLPQQDTKMPIERRHVGKRLSETVVFTPGGERVVYLAGQVADDRSADITTQAKQVLEAIDRLLAEVGSDKTRLLSATIFLPDMADFPALNAVWETWVVPGQTPARATVEAKLAHPDYKVEIQVVATAPA